jgi:hypothetical protein
MLRVHEVARVVIRLDDQPRLASAALMPSDRRHLVAAAVFDRQRVVEQVLFH